jgi:hypothetical protein
MWNFNRKTEAKRSLRDLGVEGKMLLKWMYVNSFKSFSCFTVGSSSGYL